jgi:hypothetical protein
MAGIVQIGRAIDTNLRAEYGPLPERILVLTGMSLAPSIEHPGMFEIGPTANGTSPTLTDPNPAAAAGGPSIAPRYAPTYFVNGQVNPIIAMRPGETQVWTVANFSPFAAYSLGIYRIGPDGRIAAPAPLFLTEPSAETKAGRLLRRNAPFAYPTHRLLQAVLELRIRREPPDERAALLSDLLDIRWRRNNRLRGCPLSRVWGWRSLRGRILALSADSHKECVSIALECDPTGMDADHAILGHDCPLTRQHLSTSPALRANHGDDGKFRWRRGHGPGHGEREVCRAFCIHSLRVLCGFVLVTGVGSRTRNK